MKRISLLTFIYCCFQLLNPAQAQTLIINPNTDGGFEMGNSFAANGWTAVNYQSTGNNWRLSNATLTMGQFSFQPTGNRAAYISSNTNGSWNYNINQYSTTHIYKTVSFPAGQEVIKLKFRWNAWGEGPIYDVMYVYSSPTTVTPTLDVPTGTSNNTNAWSGSENGQLHATLHSSNSLNGSEYEITLPASFAGTSRKLIFTWKNGNTLGAQPPAAIDSIWLFADCPKPSINLSNNSNPCSNTIFIQSNVTNPSNNGTYAWFINNSLLPGISSANLNSNTIPSGSTVKCVYSSNNACQYKDSASIVVNYHLNTSATDTLNICSDALPTVWRGITIPANAVSHPQYTTVNVPKPDGCDSIISLQLNITTAPPKTTETIAICRGQMRQLTWRGITIPESALSAAPYDSVRVSSPNGCDSLIFLNLNILEAGTVNENKLTACDYAIVNNRRYYSDTTFSDTLRGQSGCDSVINITKITIVPFQLNLNAPQASNYVTGGQIDLITSSTNNEPYSILSWEPSYLFPNQMIGRQTISGPEFATVTVIGENNYGCKDTASVTLNSQKIDYQFQFPNAFTPNGDGKNDEFKPVFLMKQNYQILRFEIFNRWGQMIWGTYSGEANKGWDGYHANSPAATGVYHYVFKVIFKDGHIEDKKGSFQLIR